MEKYGVDLCTSVCVCVHIVSGTCNTHEARPIFRKTHETCCDFPGITKFQIPANQTWQSETMSS